MSSELNNNNHNHNNKQKQRKRRVVYLRDDSACRYDMAVQSPQHPMKPWRLTAVHGLVRRLGLFGDDDDENVENNENNNNNNNNNKVMKVMTPPPLPAELLKDFHLPDYLFDLERTSNENWNFTPKSANAGEWIPLHERATISTTATTNTNTTTNQQQQQNKINEDAAAASTETTSSSNQQNNDENNNNNNNTISNSSPTTNATTTTTTTSSNTNTNNKQQVAPSCFTPYDCPVLQGGLEYSRIVAGSSLFGAVLLNTDAADIVINWTGGMHHARAGACSGFCYANDCVFAIRELLRCHQRVLYIDLDVHHGDGVEEAFYDSDRVFTLSLHKFADGFFPGTGHPADVGIDAGRYYNMNVPLRDGIRDEEYCYIFDTAFHGIMKAFQPDAIVLQCGADSLAGDRLGGTTIRLSSAGHARCVRTVRDSGISKLLALGGGGYSVRHVARLWAYETAVLAGVDDKIHSRSVVTLPNVSKFLSCNNNDNNDSNAKTDDVGNNSVDVDDGSNDILTRRKASASSSSSSSSSTLTISNESLFSSSSKLLLDASSFSSHEIQKELEDRALMLIFADEALRENVHLLPQQQQDDDEENNNDTDDNQNEFVVGEEGEEEKKKNDDVASNLTCCLFVSSDDGGFEARQAASSTSGFCQLHRYVQSVIRRINEHLTMLNASSS